MREEKFNSDPSVIKAGIRVYANKTDFFFFPPSLKHTARKI